MAQEERAVAALEAQLVVVHEADRPQRAAHVSRAADRERAGALELVRRVHVHEGDRRIAEPGHLGLADLDARARDRRRIPRSSGRPARSALLDVAAGTPGVRGVHGLELLADRAE
mgnify:CR=1 FL=1